MTTSKIRILGVDPGTAIVGWAILEKDGSDVYAIDYGHIETSPETPMPQRLSEIASDLEEIIDTFQPQEAAVEDLFFFKNQKTIVTVSQGRGVILLTLERKNVTIHQYTPLQIKQSITGYGRAEKKQIQEMVRVMLGLKNIPKPDDVADAIAIALCHINSRKHTTLVQKSLYSK